jgi:competence protein ComEC
MKVIQITRRPKPSGIGRPVPIKPPEELPMPALSAAMGMAFSYYSYRFLLSLYSGLYLILAFGLVIIVILLRVLRSFPGTKSSVFERIGISALAVTVGFSLGVPARRSVSGPPETGLAAERITAVTGILREDPRTLQSGSGLGTLELSECTAQGGLRASARGSLTVFFPAGSIPRLKEFGRGCEIYTDGVYAVTERGPLFRASSVHVTKPASALETFRTSLRQTLLERFQGRQLLWGGLASALLLGMRDDLNVDLSEGFRNSGCSHILALSGMHLAIISGVLAFFLRRPFGIRWASLLGALFISFYIFVAGSQPSLVRAGIMYFIGTFMLWGLLKGKPLSLLSMAFILQLLFQSESGISISFILSYLALAGILTLGETVRNLFKGRLPEILSVPLSASIGAFVLTAPVVSFYFGTLRPVGILAGLVLAPLSSLFMLLALAALAASFLPLSLWELLDFTLSWLYRLLEFSVSFTAKVPGFTVLNPFPVLLIAVLFWILALFIQRRNSVYRDSIASFD